MQAARMRAHLAAAEEHIAGAEARIRKQEERIQQLPPGSRERQKAEDILKDLRDLKSTMEKHRELRNAFWLNATSFPWNPNPIFEERY
jgi:hypothetical protein